MASTLKALSYSRVSTPDQNPEAQVIELRKYCVSRDWDLIREVVDHGFSGGSDQRPGLKELMVLARGRKVDVVVVTKLDRMARSLRHLVSMLDEFSSLGVKFVSVKDQIDLTTASGRLMVHIVGAFAEFERSLIRERTIAGLLHAKSKGKRLGRPRKHDPVAIRKLRAEGMSYRAIASRLSVPMGAITRALKGAHKTPSNLPSKNPIKTGSESE